MGQFTISIEANGAVSGLQSKPGKGFDLRQLGQAQIKRASEIVWVDVKQKWQIQVTRGRHSGRVITLTDIVWSKGGREPISDLCQGVTAYFDEYDDAVAAEIMVLDHIRRTEGAAALR